MITSQQNAISKATLHMENKVKRSPDKIISEAITTIMIIFSIIFIALIFSHCPYFCYYHYHSTEITNTTLKDDNGKKGLKNREKKNTR